MSDIELVIKVPKDTYKDIIKNGFIYDEDNEVVTHAIKNGTPLSKGHGKLIDAYGEIKKFCNKVCGHTLEECGYGFYCPLVQRMISAPAIIEADNESEDK